MDYEKKYKEALEKARQLCAYPTTKPFISDLQDIFPELKESDDEKIRKEIIELVMQPTWKTEKEFHRRNELCVWFEKQCEQKPIISNNALREGITHFGITQYQIDNWLKKYVDVEKQGEQKPAKVEPKFKVGDVIRLKGSAAEYTIKKVTDTTYYTNGWSCGIERCEEDYELVEQKPAWSEEDEYIIEEIEAIIDAYVLEENNPKALIDWLKSLRPQNTWKPSDEQMNALWFYAEQNNYAGAVLTSLYNDLKKLKE